MTQRKDGMYEEKYGDDPDRHDDTVMTVTATVTGCQSDTSKEKEETLYGEVSKIDGNEITIALGEEPKKPEEGEAPQDENVPPAKPEADGGTGQEDESEETMPEGEIPEGSEPQGGMNPGITLTGEEKTITVDEDTEYQKTGGNMGGPQGEAQEIKDRQEDQEASLDDLEEGDIVTVVLKGDQASSIAIQTMGKGMDESSEGTIALSGVYTVDGEEKTSKEEDFESNSEDENAVLVTGKGTLTMTGATLSKTGDTSSADESNFYAVNAIFAVADHSTATLGDATLESEADGSNAVFATGEASKITADNLTIHTKGDSSRGLDATYGGTIEATNVDITTEGAHCAPIATDRGEGTIVVEGGTLSAAGEGSPCIYSTGDITAKTVTGTAMGSQAAVVEGKNSITLRDCDLTGAGENGVMLYQSTSGDAAEGTARFSAADSRIATTSDGPMFYITNTDAEAVLENTTLEYGSGILVKASGNNTNHWGEEGANGGNFTLNATKQELEGDITCDEISTVALSLADGSSYKGTIDGSHTGKEVSILLDEDSVWEVTGDSYVAAITDADESLDNLKSNGHTIYYDASNSANEWLDGKTVELNDGGHLKPI